MYIVQRSPHIIIVDDDVSDLSDEISWTIYIRLHTDAHSKTQGSSKASRGEGLDEEHHDVTSIQLVEIGDVEKSPHVRLRTGQKRPFTGSGPVPGGVGLPISVFFGNVVK